MKKTYCNIDYRLDEKSGCPVAVVDVKNIKKYLDLFKVNKTSKFPCREWGEDGSLKEEYKERYVIKEFFTWKISRNDDNGYYSSFDLLFYLYKVETYNEDVRIFPVRDAKMFYDICKKLSAIVGHLIGAGLDLNKKISYKITGEDDADWDLYDDDEDWGGNNVNWNWNRRIHK